MKYAFFDIDNTLYNGYITSDFYLFIANRGYISEKIYDEDKKIGDLYHSGKIDYAEASKQVVKLTAKFIKNESVSDVEQWQKEFEKEKKDKVFPWVEELLVLLRNSEYKIYFITAAASPPAKAIANYLKADKVFSSELIVGSEIYTGLTGRILNYEEKRNLVHKIIGHLPKAKKIGFGDSTGDVDMLSHMDASFLYKPTNDELKELANDKGWNIVDETNILQKVKENL